VNDEQTASKALDIAERLQAELIAVTRERDEALAKIEQLDLAVAYAPENAFRELTKDGIEFAEVDDNGEPTETMRRVVFWEDNGDPSVGIQSSSGWIAEKPHDWAGVIAAGVVEQDRLTDELAAARAEVERLKAFLAMLAANPSIRSIWIFDDEPPEANRREWACRLVGNVAAELLAEKPAVDAAQEVPET
jgi:hypothetical protein